MPQKAQVSFSFIYDRKPLEYLYKNIGIKYSYTK